jgi:erythromycin esterase-like protein
MAANGQIRTLSEVTRAALPLSFHGSEYDPLLKTIGDSRVVLIGEAIQGTHDVYRERVHITSG